jgi:hypothetical protein
MQIRTLQTVACIFNILNCCANLSLALGFTFGLSTFWFVIVQTLFFDSIYQAFAFLPVYVVFTKLVPTQVEGSIFALLTGISAFSTLVYGRMLGVYFNTFFDVTLEDTKQMWCLMAIQLVSAVLPLFFLWLLPTKSDIERAQNVI